MIKYITSKSAATAPPAPASTAAAAAQTQQQQHHHQSVSSIAVAAAIAAACAACCCRAFAPGPVDRPLYSCTRSTHVQQASKTLRPLSRQAMLDHQLNRCATSSNWARLRQVPHIHGTRTKPEITQTREMQPRQQQHDKTLTWQVPGWLALACGVGRVILTELALIGSFGMPFASRARTQCDKCDGPTWIYDWLTDVVGVFVVVAQCEAILRIID